MNEREIAAGLAYIEAATRETLSDETRLIYISRLKDLGNDKAWEQACVDLGDSCQHMPKLPDIREAYRAAVARQPGQSEIGEHMPTLAERRETAAMLRSWMNETFGPDIEIVKEMK